MKTSRWNKTLLENPLSTLQFTSSYSPKNSFTLPLFKVLVSSFAFRVPMIDFAKDSARVNKYPELLGSNNLALSPQDLPFWSNILLQVSSPWRVYYCLSVDLFICRR
jgi:hypothetical protein